MEKKISIATLHAMPKHIIESHSTENLVEFVLHELYSPTCFNLKKIAYVVKNPDFKCIKGIAGLDSNEVFITEEPIWKCKAPFLKHMQNSFFNNKVRALKKDNYSEGIDKMTRDISEELQFENPSIHTIPLKHDNIGILLYQKNNHDLDHETIEHGFSFLQLCPLF